jgi:Lrp/AsnC family transcriptional regulator, leucine-responsive regulatory protein
MPMSLDAVDYAILAVLQAEGRIPIVELSKRVNLSATPCTLRIRALEQDGLITGYHAMLDAKALGRALLVFVQVKLKATDEATLAAFKTAITPVEQVLECHMVGGGFDFLLKLRVADMQEYRDILGGMIGALPMVENTHSYFVMEEVKETHMLPLPKPQKRR